MESYCSLCTLDAIHRLFFGTRLIINKTIGGFSVGESPRISQFLRKQWASALLSLRNGELRGHSPIRRDA